MNGSRLFNASMLFAFGTFIMIISESTFTFIIGFIFLIGATCYLPLSLLFEKKITGNKKQDESDCK